jgi:hypothetical protein
MAAAVTVALAAFLLIGGFLAVRFTAEGTLGQCAPPLLAGTDPQLCLSAAASRGTLTVSGTTSLPDGAAITVWAENGRFDRYRSTGTASAIVLDGAFRQVFDVSGWGAGTIVVTAEFAVTADQPRAVIDRYGWGGERLRGPDVRPDYDRGRPAPMEVRSSIQVDLPAA